jgi:hypothetical protein
MPSDPHDIAADLRACAAWISEPFADAEMVGRLTALADSFDQPGELRFNRETGLMEPTDRGIKLRANVAYEDLEEE